MKAATAADAHFFAKELRARSNVIHDALLFGSVLRDGKGNDVDLILIVDEQLARAWWKESRYDIRVRMGTRWLPLRRVIKKYCSVLDHAFIAARKERRIAVASRILGVDILSLVRERGIAIDVFLLPANWRHGLALNKEILPMTGVGSHHETVRFLERVAASAKHIS
ncbi:MAG: hypothetical protein JO019_04405 [Candidatus Kaiserbacteria bacterium]|nr:hypothetical protein [Candidatus Kaiserbacteria bacterium]